MKSNVQFSPAANADFFDNIQVEKEIRIAFLLNRSQMSY
jgi:hypothetical protein